MQGPRGLRLTLRNCVSDDLLPLVFRNEETESWGNELPADCPGVDSRDAGTRRREGRIRREREKGGKEGREEREREKYFHLGMIPQRAADLP